RLLVGLPVTVAGLATAARAMFLVDDRRTIAWVPRVSTLLFAMALVGLFAPVVPGASWHDPLVRFFFVAGAASTGVLILAGETLRGRVTMAVVATSIALHLVTPLDVRDPRIDVFLWTQSSLDALRHGIHPYTIDIVYQELGGRTAPVYPYMPFT